MDVRIGVTYTPKELVVQIGDGDADGLRADIEKAVADGGMLWVEDTKGRRIGVPADKVAYVELGAPGEDRRIGFGAA